MGLKENTKRLKQNLRWIRTVSESTTLSYNHKVVLQMLRENLQLLEREGIFALKVLRKTAQLPVDEHGETMVDLCETAVMHMEQDLIRSLITQMNEQNRWFATAEISSISALLKMHLISLASVGIKNDNVDTLSTAIRGIHQIKDLDIEELFAQFSYTEKAFSSDPSEIYPKMDQPTKAYYRICCEKLAKKKGITEQEQADHTLKQARTEHKHIGFYLLPDYLGYHKTKFRGIIMLITRFLLPFSLSILLSIIFHSWLLWIPFFFVSHQILRPFIERISTMGTPPYFLPRMEFNQKVPEEVRTLVTVSCLMPEPDDLPKVTDHLEALYLSNHNGAIDFSLLIDYPSAEQPETEDDQIKLQATVRAINQLNKKYENHFYAFVRKRTYCNTQNEYCGWERKRGALLQLAHGIRNSWGDFSCVIGDKEKLSRVKYLYALDQDTQLTFNAVYNTVTAAAHPCNQPQIDPNTHRVKSGFGILMPLTCEAITNNTTIFSKIFCAKGGVSSYNAACSNHYQDLLGETVFSGKGLLHIDAFLACLWNRMEEERTLSHDIVEGGVLRCGLVSDVELADSDPRQPLSWNRRLHRWIRGDFQNAAWLIPTFGRHKNPLSMFCRMAILDNLIRHLYPVALFGLLIIASMCQSLCNLCVAVFLLGIFSTGVYSFLQMLFRYGTEGPRLQTFSRNIPAALIILIRNLYSIFTVASDCFLVLNAAVKGLYRRFISHKNCLEWIPASDVARKQKRSFSAYIRANGWSVLFGLIFLLLAPSSLRIFGAFLLLCPVVQWLVAKQTTTKESPLRPAQRTYLLEEGRKLWQFYQDHCTKEENFLPPDNIQEQPVFAVAHRTSPTNIGLMMLSCVCAQKLGFISVEEMLKRLDNTLSTVEKLERYQGHLLNWYNTQTAEALTPRYCSTVDSGNYVCCIYTVRNHLKTIPNNVAKQLINRITQELERINFSCLYNRHRNLFHIGYDLERKALSASYYDMLMSEARMTDYYAVAKRQVPPKHWHSLNRTMTRQDGYVGPLSWTGTAFEYLMPPLLLPHKPNTLFYEAVHFCIHCQKRAVKHGQPWGYSESGFYEFDDECNYQYKPHGVTGLALKCYDTKERVVSPYSTFLAMPFDLKAAMKNLRLLEKMKMQGRYGFYEAMDFTGHRCRHTEHEIVQSYMAHHVGMSLCAITNTLEDFYLQNLFMQQEMAGASSLLNERIPHGADVYDHYAERKSPQKPTLRRNYSGKAIRPNVYHPEYALFTNHQQELQISSLGCTRHMWRDLQLYGTSNDFLENDAGMILMVKTPSETIALTDTPHYMGGEAVRWYADQTSANFSVHNKEVSVETKVSLSKNYSAEVRTFRLQNRTNRNKDFELMIYFEPRLHAKEQIRSHPAFYKLFIESHWDEINKRLVYTKRPRNGEQNACLVVGFSDSQIDYKFCCSSRNSIEYEGNRFKFLPIQQSSSACTPDPCCYLSIPFHLNPRQTVERTLVLAVGETKEQAIISFNGSIRDEKASSLFDKRTVENKLAEVIMPYLVNHHQQQRQGVRIQNPRRNHLWSVGISGDLPILVCEIINEAALERCKIYLDAWALLSNNKLNSDFVILYHEHGDYHRQKYNEILTAIQNLGYTSKLHRAGGIHLINTATIPSEVKLSILAFSTYIIRRSLPQKADQSVSFAPIQLRCANRQNPNEKPTLITNGGYFAEGKFVITHRPSVPWSHLLTTPSFGTLVTDQSLGFTFAYNSRENRLTPWSNDPITHHVGELLIAKVNGCYYDLIRGATAVFSKNAASYYGRIEDQYYHVTVRVTNNKKTITLTRNNTDASWLVAYYVTPVLGFDRKDAMHLKIHSKNTLLTVEQPFQTAFNGFMSMHCNLPFFTVCNIMDFWQGKWQNSSNDSSDCCAVISQVYDHASFSLSYHPEEETVTPLLPDVTQSETAIAVKTNNVGLNEMVNTFLPHQTVASRLYGRTGFYQCSGAYGFRDQLQDASNLVLLYPELTKQQILLCCRRQFSEGDVLHWWNELPSGPSGVRTRCSDDTLWLPLSVARYVQVTNDQDLLVLKTPTLQAEPLAEGCQERYDASFETGAEFSVYEHGKLAIDRVRFSKRGLALIGSCDWNDGFSAVGTKGQGESVWLTQFFALVCDEYAKIASLLCDHVYENQLREKSKKCKKAVEAHCWNETHYTRAYFDDGRVIGSNQSVENQIDVLPQAFAVIAGLPNQERNRLAIETAYRRTVDHENRLIRLFTPPFDQINAGYISAYPKGIRENGGQYTHGVIWLIQALLALREPEKAYTLIEYVNPATHTLSALTSQQYQGEPYAVAGDVYTHADAMGRCGWTHYTGAAGWLYRIIIEDLFGIHREGNTIRLQPCLPKALYHSTVTLTTGQDKLTLSFCLSKPCEQEFRITIRRGHQEITVTDNGLVP